MPDPTVQDIRMPSGVRVPTLVADPTLIKIRAIKRKYVDQIPQYGGTHGATLPGAWHLEVIGATDAWVVCRRGSSPYLLKIHRVSWVDHLCEGIRKEPDEEGFGARLRACREDAAKQIEAYPQLFED